MTHKLTTNSAHGMSRGDHHDFVEAQLVKARVNLACLAKGLLTDPSLVMSLSRWQMSCRARSSKASSSWRVAQVRHIFCKRSRAFSARMVSTRLVSASTPGPWPGGGGGVGPELAARAETRTTEHPAISLRFAAPRCTVRPRTLPKLACLRARHVSSLGNFQGGLLLPLTQEPWRMDPAPGETN